MVFGRVLEQLPQLQGVFADLLHRSEQEAGDGDVNHLLQEAAGLKEVLVPARLHEALQFGAGRRVGVAVLRVDRKTLALWGGTKDDDDDDYYYERVKFSYRKVRSSTL